MICLARAQQPPDRTLGAAGKTDQVLVPLPQIGQVYLGRFPAFALQIGFRG